MEALTIIVIMVILALPLFIALRYWIRGSSFNEVVDGDGLVAVVTGANSGIGKELTGELAKRKVKVYMMCSNLDRATKAREDLIRKYTIDPEKLVILLGDLSKFETVRLCVEELKIQEQKVDILVNNAGIFLNKEGRWWTADGFEVVWQSNYLGHVLLTKMLMPLLEASTDGGRVVNVSSWVHNIPLSYTVLSPHPTDEGFFSYIKPYLRSKLAQVMHAIAFSICLRNKPGTKVTINSCNPGNVITNIFPYPPYFQWLRSLLYPMEWFILKTANDGAQTPLFVALSRTIAGVSGKYFSECKEEESRQYGQSNFELNSLRLLDESLHRLILSTDWSKFPLMTAWEDLECIQNEIAQRTTAKEQEEVSNDLQGIVTNGNQKEVLGQPSISIKMPFDAIDI